MFLSGVLRQVEEHVLFQLGLKHDPIRHNPHHRCIFCEGKGPGQRHGAHLLHGEAPVHMGGHLGVLIDGQPGIPHGPHQLVTAIGDAQCTAEITHDRILVNRRVGRSGFGQGSAGHVFGDLHAKIVQQSGRNIDGLDEADTVDACGPTPGIPEEERSMYQFLIIRHRALTPPGMFPVEKTVVGVYDQHGILPQIMPVHEIQHTAQTLIAKLHQAVVPLAHILNKRR